MSSERKGITRKKFILSSLAGTGVLLAGALGMKWLTGSRSKTITGKIHGAPAERGHLLRTGKFPEPSETISTSVVIAGGGIAGLSAARMLLKSGIKDFLLLELDDETGGNSRSGKNEVSAYPWGAHYLPVPDPANTALTEFLHETGVITSFTPEGLPVYHDVYLCADPQERLLIHAHWQDGVVPQSGLPREDAEQIRKFLAFTHALKHRKGSDGKDVFALPVDHSSADAEWTVLDKLSMYDWMMEQGYTSEYLQWYADYCCRDDFGTALRATSAWAGLHYFASRKGTGANAPEGSVLTWPEGNGWLAARLYEGVKENVRSGYVVYAAENHAAGATVLCYDARSHRSVKIQAEKVICALPQFVAQKVIPSAYDRSSFTYGPWLVANVTLTHRPSGEGAELSWDNVQYGSRTLGYIHARHQNLRGFPDPETVITWYEALADQPPHQARQMLFSLTWEQCRDRVLMDLEKMHPGISAYISSVDVWKWGHAMICPVPGFITGSARQEAQRPDGNIHFAHSDLSGMSLFEEAFAQGHRAAAEVVQSLRTR